MLRLRKGHFRSLLAQFGLTPKSRRGLTAGEGLDPLDGVWKVTLEPVAVEGGRS